MQIDYQQIRVICTNPSTLRYLENCLRRHEEPRHGPKTTYELTLEYEGGGRATFGSYWHKSGFWLGLSENDIDHGELQGVSLAPPVPTEVEEIVGLLTQPEKHEGTVLIIEPDGTARI